MESVGESEEERETNNLAKLSTSNFSHVALLFFGRGLSLVNPCQTLLFCTQCAKLHASRITTPPPYPSSLPCLDCSAQKAATRQDITFTCLSCFLTPTPSRPCVSGQWPRPLSHATAIKTSWRFIILNARQTNKNNNEGGCE